MKTMCTTYPSLLAVLQFFLAVMVPLEIDASITEIAWEIYHRSRRWKVLKRYQPRFYIAGINVRLDLVTADNVFHQSSKKAPGILEYFSNTAFGLPIYRHSHSGNELLLNFVGFQFLENFSGLHWIHFVTFRSSAVLVATVCGLPTQS